MCFIFDSFTSLFKALVGCISVKIFFNNCTFSHRLLFENFLEIINVPAQNVIPWKHAYNYNVKKKE